VLGALETLIFLHDSIDLSFLANGLTPKILVFEWCAFLNAVATTAIMLLNWQGAKQHQRALRSGFLAFVWATRSLRWYPVAATTAANIGLLLVGTMMKPCNSCLLGAPVVAKIVITCQVVFTSAVVIRYLGKLLSFERAQRPSIDKWRAQRLAADSRYAVFNSAAMAGRLPERADQDYDNFMSSDVFDPDVVDKMSEYVQILQADRAALAAQVLAVSCQLDEARTPEKRGTVDSEAFEAMFQKDFHEQSQMNAKHHELLSQNEQLKAALKIEGANNTAMLGKINQLKQALERAMHKNAQGLNPGLTRIRTT